MQKEDLNDLSKTFYGLGMEGFQRVYDLNFKGTLLPTMVFTLDMLESGKGCVLNISSMNAYLPLTKIPAYSAAKASVNSRLFPDQPEPFPAHRRKNGRSYPPRSQDYFQYSYGEIRRTRRPDRRHVVPVERYFFFCYRCYYSGGRRLQCFRRSLVLKAYKYVVL